MQRMRFLCQHSIHTPSVHHSNAQSSSAGSDRPSSDCFTTRPVKPYEKKFESSSTSGSALTTPFVSSSSPSASAGAFAGVVLRLRGVAFDFFGGDASSSSPSSLVFATIYQHNSTRRKVDLRTTHSSCASSAYSSCPSHHHRQHRRHLHRHQPFRARQSSREGWPMSRERTSPSSCLRARRLCSSRSVRTRSVSPARWWCVVRTHVGLHDLADCFQKHLLAFAEADGRHGCLSCCYLEV